MKEFVPFTPVCIVLKLCPHCRENKNIGIMLTKVFDVMT